VRPPFFPPLQKGFLDPSFPFFFSCRNGNLVPLAPAASAFFPLPPQRNKPQSFFSFFPIAALFQCRSRRAVFFFPPRARLKPFFFSSNRLRLLRGLESLIFSWQKSSIERLPHFLARLPIFFFPLFFCWVKASFFPLFFLRGAMSSRKGFPFQSWGLTSEPFLKWALLSPGGGDPSVDKRLFCNNFFL